MSSRLDEWERRTAPILTALASAALISLVLESAFDTHTVVGTAVDYLAWASFAADYAVRLRLAETRWRFVRGHPLDLIAVLLPALRALRLVASIARMAALAPGGGLRPDGGGRLAVPSGPGDRLDRPHRLNGGRDRRGGRPGRRTPRARRNDHFVRRRGVVGALHGDHRRLWRPLPGHQR